MSELLNEIANRLRNMEEVEDSDFYRAVQEINDNYIILAPTKKSVEFTKQLNDALGFNFNYKNAKLPIGLTFEELFLKSIAFYHKDPFSYINKNCIIIHKNEKVINYLDSIELMSKLTGEEHKDLTTARMKLFTDKFKERIQKDFSSRFEQLLPSGFVYRSPDEPVYFEQGHCFLQVQLKIHGTKQEHEDRFVRDNSEIYNKVEPMVKNLTQMVFKEDFNLVVHDNINLSRKLIKNYDGKTVFRNSKMLHQNGRNTKRGYMNPYFYCYIGMFLDYNQYCDIISKGELQGPISLNQQPTTALIDVFQNTQGIAIQDRGK